MSNLIDLPHKILCKILCLTSRRDVCRFACISNLCRSAADSDDVWTGFLPPAYQLDRILSLCTLPLIFGSKRELYFKLCNPISAYEPISEEEGAMLVWLERFTGKVNYIISATCIEMNGKFSYLKWSTLEYSSFAVSLEIKEMVRVEIEGEFDCRLLSAHSKYRVSFAVIISSNNGNGSDGHDFDSGVSLCIRTPDGKESRSNAAWHEERQDEWNYMVAADFFVKPEWAFCAEPVYVCFSLSQADHGSSKVCLILDGVKFESIAM